MRRDELAGGQRGARGALVRRRRRVADPRPGPPLRRSRDGHDAPGVRPAGRRPAPAGAARRLRDQGHVLRPGPDRRPLPADRRADRRGRPRGRPPLVQPSQPGRPGGGGRARGLRARARGARPRRRAAEGPPQRAVGGELGHAVAGRRVRARVRLHADGRRQAVPARDRPRAPSPSSRRTGASTTGSSTPTCRARRSAPTSSHPRRCSTCGPTSSTRCDGTAACSCSPTTRSCPGARGGWRRCASSSSTRSAAATSSSSPPPRSPRACARTRRRPGGRCVPSRWTPAIYPEL